MYAITTRYHTTANGAGRVTATTRYGPQRISATVPYPHDRGEGSPAQYAAVEALLAKVPGLTRLHDSHRLVAGMEPVTGHYVWVWVER